MIKDILDTKIIDFKFSKTEFLKLITKIQNTIKQNKNLLDEAYEIDKQYYEFKLKEEKILRILENYKEADIKNDVDLENVLIKYRGNPYTTVELCLEAIINKKRIIIDPNDFMLGVNSIIVEFINGQLSSYGIKELISIYNLIPNTEIKQCEAEFAKIMVIDETEICDDLYMLKVQNIEEKFVNYINLYCADDELIELRNLICDFADENNIALEVWDDCSKEEIADTLENSALGNIVILLTKDKNLQEECKRKILTKKLYINENKIENQEKFLNIF